MAKAAVTAITLLWLSVAPQTVFAQDEAAPVADMIPDEVHLVATEFNLDPVDLWGAMQTTNIWNPRDYLCLVGEGPCTSQFTPVPNVVENTSGCGWPICGALGKRIYCIEGIESTHGANMGPNPIGIWNAHLQRYEHAAGWLGYLGSTANGVGATIGNRASEWQGAAYMLAHGRGREFAGVAMGLC